LQSAAAIRTPQQRSAFRSSGLHSAGAIRNPQVRLVFRTPDLCFRSCDLRFRSSSDSYQGTASAVPQALQNEVRL
jgi:hypothetical protein